MLQVKGMLEEASSFVADTLPVPAAVQVTNPELDIVKLLVWVTPQPAEVVASIAGAVPTISSTWS